MGAESVGGSGFNVYVNSDKVKKTPFSTLIARMKEGYDNASANPVKVKKPPSLTFDDIYAEDDGGDIA